LLPFSNRLALENRMNEILRKSISVVYKLAFLLSVLIFINILFGPLVRATDSGLACPDWPLCHGKVIPPPEFRIWMEVGHRIYSGLLGFVILALAIIIFKNSELRSRFGLSAFTALVVLVNQVILGKLTVTKLLDPGTVNMHLLNAVFLFTLIVSITAKANFILKTGLEEIRLVNWLAVFNSKNLLISLTVFLVYFQLFMGGRVSSNYAGLACSDWPTCKGQWFPAMEGLVQIQMEHRFVAYLIVFLIILNVAVSIFKSYDPRTRLFLKLALYAVGFQIILGVSNVLFQLPTLVTAAHTGMGVAVFILVYTALYYRLLPEDNSL
jgi:cytochrome c oxidase assembly protein subunit 15